MCGIRRTGRGKVRRDLLLTSRDIPVVQCAVEVRQRSDSYYPFISERLHQVIDRRMAWWSDCGDDLRW